MAKHKIEELNQLQALPLSQKVEMTKRRIREWVDYYGTNGVYVSFSGGKDSTVLLNIVREMYPNVEAVFLDTGLEYPELRKFVKTFDNVTWLKPKKTFKEVINTFGYPVISKEVSALVHAARKYKLRYEETGDTQVPNKDAWERINGLGDYQKSYSFSGRYSKYKRQKQLMDYEKRKTEAEANGVVFAEPEPRTEAGRKVALNKEKYKFLLDAPFEIHDECCRVMKKNPAHAYANRSGKKPITGQMASESRLRAQKWLLNGCNGFDLENPISNPMNFWTEQDVLAYIYENNIEIASIYGDVIIEGSTTPPPFEY